MDTKTVKISETNYRWLCTYAGELQKELGEPVSIDKAITFLHKNGRIHDLAGSWKLSDKEAEDMMKHLKKGWSTWKISSV